MTARGSRTGGGAGHRAVLLAGVAVAALVTVVARRLASRPAVLLRRADGRPIDDVTGAPLGLVSHARRATGVRGAAHSAPPTWEPALLSRLGRWEPPPPATPVGRIGGYLWASPLTVAGLLAGAASGVVPRPHAGTLLFAGARGLPGRFFADFGYSAFTLGHVIVAAQEQPSPALLAHELVHTRQAERLGPLLAPVYLVLRMLYGYARNPMERAARRAQRRVLGVPDRA